ncbi:MAG: NlpC/P60 family protein [Bacteroidota bacterium]
MYYFCQEAFIPLRQSPSEAAEMVSQLLFGEFALFLKEKGSWWQVQNLTDQYEGWVNAESLLGIEEETFESIVGYRYLFTANGSLIKPDGTYLRLPLGARLPLTPDPKRYFQLTLGEHSWILGPEVVENHRFAGPEAIIEVARMFLNVPYLWGGRTSFGIDCSGLTQTVFHMCGLKLPRDTSLQIQEGTEVDFDEKQPGDLAYFSKPNQGRVSHVAIIAPEEKVIHASGRVRVDDFKENGIIQAKTFRQTHDLITIKRHNV